VPWDDYVRGDHPTSAAPFADQEGLHEIFREWRTLLESYPGQRAMVAEAWVAPHDRLARYIRPDEFHQAFNFDVLALRWDAADVRRRVRSEEHTSELQSRFDLVCRLLLG